MILEIYQSMKSRKFLFATKYYFLFIDDPKNYEKMY